MYDLLKTNKIGQAYGFSCVLKNLTREDYIRLYIANNYLNYFEEEVPHFVDPMQNNNYAFNKFIEVKLEKPYNPCDITNDTYIFANCQNSCMRDRIKEKCNCTFPSYYNTKKKISCEKEIGWGCLHAEERKLELSCNQQCPISCQSRSFKTSFHSLYLKQKENESLTILTSYFNDLNYLYISQTQKLNSVDMLCNFAGIIGKYV